MQHGSIIDWNDMEKVWQHIFHKKLNILSEDHPVLFTEPPLNSRNNREKVAEIFFEKFKVPAMYISMQSILTLYVFIKFLIPSDLNQFTCRYSTGRTTGVVLDCGDGVSSAVPIYQGFAMTNGIKRIDFAGREVTEYLRYVSII